MKLFSNKMLLLAEQALSSAFNFLIIVILSRDSQEVVANFGLVYSFALVYSALLKNGALNLFLTSGSQCLSTLNRLLSQVIFAPIHIVILLVFTLFIFAWLDNYVLIFVFLYYAFIDACKTYLIVISKYMSNFSLTFLLAIAVGSLYLLDVSVLYAFPIIVTAIFFLYLFYSMKSSNQSDSSNFGDISSQSLIMTASYTTYSHGPLWLLYLLDTSLAALFVQIRNLFQPVQIISRVVDILEKKNSSKVGDYFENFTVSIKYQAIVLSLLTLVFSVVGVLFFNSIYGFGVDHVAVYISVYAVLCIVTFLSKPIETYFYGNKNLTKLVKSRVVGGFLFFVLSLLIWLFNPSDPLILVLFALIVVWSVINLINIRTIYLERAGNAGNKEK